VRHAEATVTGFFLILRRNSRSLRDDRWQPLVTASPGMASALPHAEINGRDYPLRQRLPFTV
jgi:hypothetical protein